MVIVVIVFVCRISYIKGGCLCAWLEGTHVLFMWHGTTNRIVRVTIFGPWSENAHDVILEGMVKSLTSFMSLSRTT